MLLNDTFKMVNMANFTFYVYMYFRTITAVQQQRKTEVQETGDQTPGNKKNSQKDDKVPG